MWVLGSPGAGSGGADAREGPAGARDSHALAPAGAGEGGNGASAGASGNGNGSGASDGGERLPGTLLLRQLSMSTRGKGAGYQELRAESGGSDGSTLTAAAADAAAAASLSPRSGASLTAGAASPRGGGTLLRRALGAAGAYAWRRRQLPRALSYRYCAGALLAIAVAYASREADVRYGLWCMPRSWFQLHALWHAFAALVRDAVVSFASQLTF